MCVCVCVFFPFILDVKFVGCNTGVTQEEGHTGFLIHLLLSAVHAFIFLARRIQPFLSLVDREVEFCVLRPTLTDQEKVIKKLFFSDNNDKLYLMGQKNTFSNHFFFGGSAFGGAVGQKIWKKRRKKLSEKK